jgi:uncharacterized protein (DUF1330 family)
MIDDIDTRAAELSNAYGNEMAPTAGQWRHMLAGPADAPITIINFFKLRPVAGEGSGLQAMMSYAAVSGPALSKVGGRFLVSGPFEGTFMGDDEDWDLVAIASYPDREALLALLDDADYREAWRHRVAAVERQKVLIARG